MLRNKLEVDRHVAKALSKLRTDREKCFRGYSIGRLYFDIGDYETCVPYVTRYLTVKDNNAAAHNLLGQAYGKLGRKEEALAEFKTSLELDPSQNNLLLKVCELLSEENVNADAGCMRYWVDRATVAFPRHPTLFRLCERLLQTERGDSSALASLLRDQVAARPLDPPVHARLVRHLVQSKRLSDAFEHALNVHLSTPAPFESSFIWLDAVVEMLEAYKADAANGTPRRLRDYWLLYLTVLEKKTYSRLAWNNPPADAIDALRLFDRALGETFRCQKLESSEELSKHFGGQLCLHAGAALLKKALHEQNGWREAVRSATPALLLAFRAESPAGESDDLSSSWSCAAAHRKSQAGHTLLACSKEKKQPSLDALSQYFADRSWRERLHRDLFGNGDRAKSDASYILNPKSLFEPKIKPPGSSAELQRFDLVSRKYALGSLHLQTWIGTNLEKLPKMRSIETDELPVSSENVSNCGPETLCSHDIDAFLYCTILIARRSAEHDRKPDYGKSDRPKVLPAVLLEPLCSAEQAKWWECAERMARRDSGSYANELRPILIRGIETVRCVGNHGLDPYILAALGEIFERRAELETDARASLSKRAALYYETALPLLERLKDRTSCHPPKKRMFSFVSRNVSNENTANLIEEAKLFLGKYLLNADELRKAIDILNGVKSPYASFYLYRIHMRLADEQVNLQKENVTSEMRITRFNLLSKARKFIYLTTDRLKELNVDSAAHPLASVLAESIDSVEALLSSVDLDPNVSKNESDGEYSSGRRSSIDENPATVGTPLGYRHAPRASSVSRSVKADLRQLKENQFASESVLRQISVLLESNKLLAQQMQEFRSALDDIKSQNMTNADKKKFLTSVDDIRSKVDELREENIINTIDLKKEITDLRKELEKLKISQPAARRQDDGELLLLEETYKNSNAALSYLQRMPGTNPTLPGHPYSLYPPNLYPLYANQYPAAPQLFPPQLFAADHTLYADLTVPSQIQAPQSTQSAVHDYHISLPVQTQTISPSPLSAQSTSTPNKLIGQASQINSVPGVKPPSLFDMSKTNAEIADVPKSVSLFDTSSFSFMKDRAETSSSNLNKSRTVSERSNESYDPIPDFKPMIPLPDEVVPLTGEEEEEVLFDARAKLFRFVDGEWKERGIGQLKLLKNGATGKIRLLMRRDTIHKICANHYITPEMELSPMTGSDKAYFWVANDFADETVKLEKLCVRFKTVEIGKQFSDAFNKSKTDVEKTLGTTAVSKSTAVASTTIAQTTVAQKPLSGFNFGAASSFKTTNDKTSANPSTTAEANKQNPFANFTFAKPVGTSVVTTGSLPATIFSTNAASPVVTSSGTCIVSATDTNKTPAASGWGDLFKPKPGSWTCQICYISNTASEDYCVACESPKNPDMPKKDKKPELEASKYTFGVPAAVSTATATTTFNFGFNAQASSTPTTFSFGLPQNVSVVTSPAKNDNQPIILGSMENTKYEFGFTPKSILPKSPNKSLNESQYDENDVSQEDEGSHIFFEPVIPMPDKVDVKTGEEDEDVLYCHRAKLFRFVDSEWKECGVGDVKILQHRNTKKIRVLMRREPVMKICLNHYLTADIDYLPKDEKSWLFMTCDFSNEELCPRQFCIRFANKDVANDFKNAVEDAKSSVPSETTSVEKDEIQFVSETEVTGCRGCDNESDKNDSNAAAPIAMNEKDAAFKINNVKIEDTDKEKSATFKFNFFQNAAKTSENDTDTNPSTVFANSMKPAYGVSTTVPNFGMNLFTSQAQTITTTGNVNAFQGFKTNSPTLESLLKSSQPPSSVITVVSSSGQKPVFNTETVLGVSNNTPKPFGGFVNIFNSAGGVKDGDKNQTATFKPIPSTIPNNKNLDDEVVFVSESQVSEEDIAKARRLKLPDKFFAYKDLPGCSGCRGCDKGDEESQSVLIKNTSALPFQLLNKELKTSASGTFDFSNFTIPKTTSASIFGGNASFPNVTASSLFGGAMNSIFSGTTTTTTFSPGMLFGAKSANASIFSAANNSPNVTSFGDISKNNTSVFGGTNSFSSSTETPATDDKKSQESKSSIFGNFLTSNNIFSNTLNKTDDGKGIDLTTNKSNFNFTMSSPNTSYKDVSDDETPTDDDGSHIFFKPAIPLPDMVEVKTGEEQEEILYSHRAKLYRFASSEWKECGVGDVKILRHKENNKLRVVMRREPVMKVCLNHHLTPDIEYMVKDEKTWLFSACDFSTGEIAPQQFSIRFVNKDAANEFLKAINDARNKYIKADDNGAKDTSNELNKDNSAEETKTVRADISKVSQTKSLITPPKFTPAIESPGVIVVEKPKTVQVPVNTTAPIFGSKEKPIFSNSPSFNLTTLPVFGSNAAADVSFETIAKVTGSWVSSGDDFASLATKVTKENASNNVPKTFTWEGAGAPVFGSNANKTSKAETNSVENSVNEDNAEEHDPQFEPIIPLPDKIEVVTGEEDESIEFSQRAKLFRWHDGQWRERGLGDFKILHHSSRGTYRMLLRQEQVHKVVLNLLITAEFELMPMTNTPRSYMWVGHNYTDDEKGVVEKLAVRFRTDEMANSFKAKVDSIVEILQSPNTDEILVTDVPEEYIQARYQAEDEDATDDDGSDVYDRHDYKYDSS